MDTASHEPLVTPSMFANSQMTGGLLMFFFQFVVMMGLFFVIPLYLSVALGLSAIDTGLKITPLSLAMLLAAAGIPRFFPAVSPRRVVELGLLAVLIGIVVLFTTIDVDATAAHLAVPLILIGLGMGALASQLGSVTVSAVPTRRAPRSVASQNTASQFGASLGTALAGSVLIASLTASFLSGITNNPDVRTRSNSRRTSSSRAAGSSSPTPSSRPRCRKRASAGDEPGDPRRERAGCIDGLARPSRPRVLRDDRPVLLPPGPSGPAGIDDCRTLVGGASAAAVGFGQPVTRKSGWPIAPRPSRPARSWRASTTRRERA
jgi:hypothetical protein